MGLYSAAEKPRPFKTIYETRFQYSEIPTLSVAHNATLRMRHPNCRLRSVPHLRREANGQRRFPTGSFSKIVGLSYGQIQSPQRILSPWRQATIVATLD